MGYTTFICFPTNFLNTNTIIIFTIHESGHDLMSLLLLAYLLLITSYFLIIEILNYKYILLITIKELKIR